MRLPLWEELLRVNQSSTSYKDSPPWPMSSAQSYLSGLFLLQSTIPSLTLLCKAPLFKRLKEPVKANVNLQMEQRKHTYVRKLKQPTEVLFVVLVSFSHLPGMFCYKVNNLPSPEWWDASSHTNQTNLPATSPASSGTYSSFPRQTTLVFAPRKCYFIFYLLLFILSPLMVKIKYS